MTIDNNDLLNSILESLDRVRYIRPEDIPNIDLYMDQITTFMDSRLHSSAKEIFQGTCASSDIYLLL